MLGARQQADSESSSPRAKQSTTSFVQFNKRAVSLQSQELQRLQASQGEEDE